MEAQMNVSFPIYYETYGDPKNTSLILISGIGGQVINWPKKFLEGLVACGLYVIIFDNRDVGLSQYYDHLEAIGAKDAIHSKLNKQFIQPPYTLLDMATDVINLMDHLSIKKGHIVGISMGGMIAQLLALNFPERIASLTLIATTSGDEHLPPPVGEVAEFFAVANRNEEDINSFVTKRITLQKIYNPFYFNEQSSREINIAAYQRAYHPEGLQRQLLAMLFSEPRGDQLKNITTKCLIIHGDVDPLFPLAHAEYLADCIPNSRLEIINKMGHGLMTELCDQVVTKIADFVLDQSVLS